MLRPCYKKDCNVLVEAKSHAGRAPKCKDCWKQDRAEYNRKQNERRATARAALPPTRDRVCKRCNEEYEYTPRTGYHLGLCGACRITHFAEKRVAILRRRAAQREQLRDDPDRAAKQRQRFLARLSTLGLTERYPDLESIRCGICRTDEPTPTRGHSWYIDHDHTCCPPGRMGCKLCVRGLLCSRCNFALGLMDDDTAKLQAAIDYLAAHQRRSNM